MTKPVQRHESCVARDQSRTDGRRRRTVVWTPPCRFDRAWRETVSRWNRFHGRVRTGRIPYVRLASGRRLPRRWFRDSSVQRSLFFLFAEGLGDADFTARLRSGYAFCVRHARLVRADPVSERRLGDAYGQLLKSVIERVRDIERTRSPASPVAGTSCPWCRSAAWAEDHVIWLMAEGRADDVAGIRTSALCVERTLRAWSARVTGIPSERPHTTLALRQFETPGRWVAARVAEALWNQPLACDACRAANDALDRVETLLSVILAHRPDRAQYESTGGICLRHLNRGWRQFPEVTRRVLREVAVARADLIAWELHEDMRQVSWSVRHEAHGPEVDAIERTLTFTVGTAIHSGLWLAVEPDRPGV